MKNVVKCLSQDSKQISEVKVSVWVLFFALVLNFIFNMESLNSHKYNCLKLAESEYV